MIWVLILPFSLAFTLLAYVLAPVLPLFAGDGWLPKWLAWFQTPDNSIFGDEGHLRRWDFAMSYAQQVAWLWRNPAYGFTWGPLAIEPREPFHVSGDPWIRNRDNARAGWLFVMCDQGWGFKAIKHLFGDTALQTEFGWRLQPWAQGRGEGRAQYVFTIRLTAFNP